VKFETVKLGEIATEVKRRLKEHADLPVYSVTKHRGFVPSLEYFKKQVFSRDTKGYKEIHPGEVAYATIHLDEGSIGLCPTRCIISPMYTAFNLEEPAYPPYVVRYLKSQAAMFHYPSLGKGSIHRRRAISFSRLARLQIPLPPLAEQKRIAAILDKVDELRQKRRRAIELCDQLIRSVFLEMFGDPVTNPKGWEVRQLKELSFRITKGESPKWQGHDYVEEGALFVTSENVRDGFLDINSPKYVPLEFNKKLSRSELKKDDVLINLVGASIGRSAIFTGYSVPANVNQAVAVVTLNDTLDPLYLLTLLSSQSGKELLIGNKVEAARANISLRDIRGLEIPVPSKAMQSSFIKRINDIRKNRINLDKSLAQMNTFFNSIQQSVFRGEL